MAGSEWGPVSGGGGDPTPRGDSAGGDGSARAGNDTDCTGGGDCCEGGGECAAAGEEKPAGRGEGATRGGVEGSWATGKDASPQGSEPGPSEGSILSGPKGGGGVEGGSGASGGTGCGVDRPDARGVPVSEDMVGTGCTPLDRCNAEITSLSLPSTRMCCSMLASSSLASLSIRP
mmetsp:Transcript_9307/g.26154  ORF Transcript_9307/g.26154 Transcript_9307/m.26154 type:complete len:175 (-) Transcript_9307:1325-1849(-)